MNFYRHHIGVYAQATGHLSFAEDAAYSRLLRKYYAEEGPIAGPLKAAQRLVGARSREEREAVQTVLDEFFEWDEAGNCWRNKRADEEVARYQAQADNNRRIAEEREAKKRAKSGNETSTNRSGVVDESSHRSQHESSNESLPVREPSHKPLATSQIPEASAGSAHAVSPSPPEPAAARASATAAGRACLLMRQAGCIHANPSHADLIAAIAEGVTPEVLGDTAREALALRKGNPFAWAVATARSRHAEGAKPLAGASHAPATRPRLSLADQSAQAAAQRLTGPEPDDDRTLDGEATRVAR
jgi:uncharacterized protein YdaU (DUF1376 family)